MDTHRRSKPRSSALLWLAAVLAISATYSCSLLIETRGEQCQENADCKSGFRCDTAAHVCVAATGTGGSGGMSASSSSSTSSSSTSSGTTCDVDGGVAKGGCWDCAPTDESQILNHCTDSQCFPFDNAARVAALKDGGKLPPLPDGGP
jgi:Cys-rich repeat protein